MNNTTIAVIGATGKTGTRVLAQLKARGYATRGLSRHSERPFDWQNQQSWKTALTGVDTAYITYFPDLAVPQAESDMRDFVKLAKSLNLKHLVLLSGRGEEGAQGAEKIVKTSGLDWSIVRASWFMQNFSESFMLDGVKAGQLILPKHQATEPFIDVDDIVDVVVAAITRNDLRHQVLEITGPELLSFDHCVKAIARASQRSIELHTMPIDVYLAGAKSQGLPDDMAWLINELFVHVLDGRNEYVTNTVEQVLGRPAKNFQHYVSTTAATGVWSSAKTLRHKSR